MPFQATRRHLYPFSTPVTSQSRSDMRDDTKLKRNATCMPYMSSDIHFQCKLYGGVCRPCRKCETDTKMAGYIKSGSKGRKKYE